MDYEALNKKIAAFFAQPNVADILIAQLENLGVVFVDANYDDFDGW